MRIHHLEDMQKWKCQALDKRIESKNYRGRTLIQINHIRKYNIIKEQSKIEIKLSTYKPQNIQDHK